MRRILSVQPTWCTELPLQQQSVLLLATRGPDGLGKDHPCKPVHVAYRACTLVAAKYGRSLRWGERADGFMSLDVFADDNAWRRIITPQFFRHSDDLPLHYYGHLMHGVEILGYKHPDAHIRNRWHEFYLHMVENLHLSPEAEDEMDKRLGDWERKHWGDEGL